MRFRLFAALLGLAAAITIPPPAAHAILGVGVTNRSITIVTPLRPGEACDIPDRFGVANTGDEISTYTVSACRMSTSGLLDADPRWFRVVPSTLTLRPGKIGYVSVHLSIPQTAKAGDYVAFVTASPKQNVQKASSAIVLGAGTRVLFKVKGAPVETGAVRNTTNPRKPLPWNTLLFAFAALLGLSSFGFAAKHLKITVRWRK